MGALLLTAATITAVWWVVTGRALRWLDSRTGGSQDEQVQQALPWLLDEVAKALHREHL